MSKTDIRLIGKAGFANIEIPHYFPEDTISVDSLMGSPAKFVVSLLGEGDSEAIIP
jgi:hypothetical protein